MDSEGIWKAWMINVITKTAITTVVSTDWSDISQSGCGVFPIYFRLGTSFAGRLAARILRQRSQVFQHLVGRTLFGILLCGPFSPAHELGLTVIADRLQSNLNRKSLVVFRPQLFH